MSLQSPVPALSSTHCGHVVAGKLVVCVGDQEASLAHSSVPHHHALKYNGVITLTSYYTTTVLCTFISFMLPNSVCCVMC